MLDTPDGPRCPAHDPSRREEMRTRAKLGAARSAAVRGQPDTPTGMPWPLPGAPDTIADAKTLASAALRSVWEGAMDPKVAREVSVLVNAFVATLKAGDLAQRLADAEALITRLEAQSQQKTER